MNLPGSNYQIDSVVIDFMVNYNVPGLSIAIAKDGKMVYAKGYGFADHSTGEEVGVNSLFRIGETSIPITAIAIMKLIEEGKLALASKVFGDSGILGNKYGRLPYGVNITNITVDELLHHTGGGWSGPEDPMNERDYRDHPYTQDQLINLALQNIPLSSSPGSAFRFSNFGYFILGRVIEKASGKTYADYVNERILRPIGITDMQIESPTAEGKKTSEVTHYNGEEIPVFADNKMDDKFYFLSSRADACSGWIASATDLLRLMVRVDGFPSKPDILDTTLMKSMLSGSKPNPHYACGWLLNDNLSNWFYLGEYPGTTVEIARTTQGYCWAILCNTFRPRAQNYRMDLDQIMWKIINNPATKWPDKDLF